MKRDDIIDISTTVGIWVGIGVGITGVVLSIPTTQTGISTLVSFKGQTNKVIVASMSAVSISSALTAAYFYRKWTILNQSIHDYLADKSNTKNSGILGKRKNRYHRLEFDPRDDQEKPTVQKQNRSGVEESNINVDDENSLVMASGSRDDGKGDLLVSTPYESSNTSTPYDTPSGSYTNLVKMEEKYSFLSNLDLSKHSSSPATFPSGRMLEIHSGDFSNNSGRVSKRSPVNNRKHHRSKSDSSRNLKRSMSRVVKGDFVGFSTMQRKILLVMVGLPARGKSYIVKMLSRYLNWTGVESRVFNVGEYRRKKGYAGEDANFFDANNRVAKQRREEIAGEALNEAYEWLFEASDDIEVSDKPKVAFFDATNTTRKRRKLLLEKNKKVGEMQHHHPPSNESSDLSLSKPKLVAQTSDFDADNRLATLLFVESICDDPTILKRNYQMKLKNDDYKGQPPEIALQDFCERVKAYEKVYEGIEDDEDSGNISYIKLHNVGQKVITRNTTGYIPSQIAFYLQNIHIEPRTIWLTRHAESIDQSNNILGRDSGDITKEGKKYCKLLEKFILREHQHNNHVKNRYSTSYIEIETPKIRPNKSTREFMNDFKYTSDTTSDRKVSSDENDSDQADTDHDLPPMKPNKEILILAGTAQVHQSTVSYLQKTYPTVSTPLLNELRGGTFDGMSRDYIQKQYPDVHEAREQDKLNYRYPGAGGESYADVIQRVRPIIVELERQRRSVIVVCHLAVQRCIYGYFMGIPMEEIPRIPLDKHVVYQLKPGPHGCEVSSIRLFDEPFSDEEEEELENEIEGI